MCDQDTHRQTRSIPLGWKDGMNINSGPVAPAFNLKRITKSENEPDSNIVCGKERERDLEIDLVVFSLCESKRGRKAKRMIV